MKSLAAPFWRLYFNLEDGAWIDCAQGLCNFRADQVYLIAPGVNGETGLTRSIRHLFIHFLLDTGNAEAMQVPVAPYEVESPPALIELARALANELLVDPLKQSEACPSAHALVGWALANARMIARESLSVHPGVARVLSVLQARNYPAMNNKDLAKLANMSVNGFIRAFVAMQGEAPQYWLRRRRIGLACQRLAHSTDTIEEIAESLDFANRYHFSSVFRSFCEVGPATWRRKVGGGRVEIG